ncbi:MAG: DUF302 domain-containing protein [Planctomycetota bacterium]
MSYDMSKVLGVPYEEAVERAREALQAEGFGVLTEIDVKATLKKKLDVDFRKYVILGACNPPLAYQALQAEPNIGLLLPCNVIVQELDEGTAQVSAIDPISALGVVANEGLASMASQVRDKLQRVMDDL